MTTDPYEQITWRGHTVSRRTRAMVLTAEQLLDVVFPVYQGGWNSGGVPGSAGTHDADAIDLGPTTNPTRATRVLRRVGFAAWYRTPAQGFGYHIHAIPIMSDRSASMYLSPQARDQVTEYRSGGDGLVGNNPDPQPWRPDPIPVFDYRAWERRRLLRGRIRSLTERIHDLIARRQALRDKLEQLS